MPKRPEPIFIYPSHTLTYFEQIMQTLRVRFPPKLKLWIRQLLPIQTLNLNKSYLPTSITNINYSSLLFIITNSRPTRVFLFLLVTWHAQPCTHATHHHVQTATTYSHTILDETHAFADERKFSRPCQQSYHWIYMHKYTKTPVSHIPLEFATYN